MRNKKAEAVKWDTDSKFTRLYKLSVINNNNLVKKRKFKQLVQMTLHELHKEAANDGWYNCYE